MSSSLTVYLATQGRAEDRKLNRRTFALTQQNRALILRVQQARLESCRQTYGSFRDVFRPFFRPASQRTREEERDIRKFLRQIAKFQARCPRQTGVTKRKEQK